MRSGLLTILTAALMLPGIAAAQVFADLGISDTASFKLSAIPQYPVPYGKVSLSFLSGSIELTSATLTVSANGKDIYRGSVQPVSVTLGKAGSVTNVTAIISAGGEKYTQTLRIQPQDVALIAEPISFAPPLYPGKPLVPLDGTVRVVAMANLKNVSGKSLDPATLSYAWVVDNMQIANSSGIGKTAIMVASPLQYRSRDVAVSVMSADGSHVGGASLSLSSLEPSIRLYENDPLLGIRFNRALSGAYSIMNAESSLYAAPFSLPTQRGAPLIQWFLNGEPAQTGGSITLRPTGSGQGSASLSLTASSGEYAKATANLSLKFGEKPEFNFFGL